MQDYSAALFVGSRFRVVRATQRLEDGSELAKEIVRHPGSVTILPLLDDGRVCLIRNRRLTVNKTLLEVPAGTLDPGEEPAQTARRELAEETGYRAAHWELLLRLYPSPGVLDELMHVYVATGLSAGPTDLDHGEQIQNELVTWDEALALLAEGQIEDAKTVATLLYYHHFRRSPRHD